MSQTFKATSKAADAPDIEAGVYDARFDGVSVKFITGGQYGDGDRFEWAFTLIDDDGDVMYDEGDAVVATGLTSMSTNITSKTQPRAVRYLKGLMTPVEFASFEAGEGVDENALVGRVVQVEINITDKGWPRVANVLAARVARKNKAKIKPTQDASIDEE